MKWRHKIIIALTAVLALVAVGQTHLMAQVLGYVGLFLECGGLTPLFFGVA